MLFKKKPYKVDLYTWSVGAYEASQVKPSKSFYPGWWKNLPGSERGANTMKSCAGMIDYFRFSHVITSWTDFVITISPDGSWEWQSSLKGEWLDYHPSFQAEGLYPEKDWVHLKLTPPWKMQSQDEIYMHLTEASYHYTDYFDKMRLLPGVLEPKYQDALNLQFLFAIPKNEDLVIEIPFGQPLAHLTPITEREVNFSSHLITEPEWRKLFGDKKVAYSRNYYKRKRYSKKHSSCPFTGRSK